MEPANKKFKFSPMSTIQQHEEMFMNLHNIAMGYVPRPAQQDNAKVDIAQLAMEAFPVPPAIHDSFQSWITSRLGKIQLRNRQLKTWTLLLHFNSYWSSHQ